MTDLLARLLRLVCGQAPAHTWAPAGVPLPVCQRCVGIYAGAALAALLHALLRPPASRRSLWLHALCLLPIVPAGLHLFPQGPALRALTGFFFGGGAVHLLWFAAFAPRAPRAPRVDRFLPPSSARGRWALYAALLVASFSFVLALALRGSGPHVALLLAALSAAGLLSLGLLALAALWSVFVPLHSDEPR